MDYLIFSKINSETNINELSYLMNLIHKRINVLKLQQILPKVEVINDEKKPKEITEEVKK